MGDVQESNRRRLNTDLYSSAKEDRPARSRSRRKAALRRRRQRLRRALLAVVGIALVFVFYKSATSLSVARRARLASDNGSSEGRPGRRPAAFGNVSGTGLRLVLPARREKIIGIGYHQAYNQKAIAIESQLAIMPEATSRSVMAAAGRARPRAFVMASRGRGSALTSSVDIAVAEGVRASSPVTGRVLAVRPYLLYGNQEDVRIDILADGYNNFKISVVHLTDPQVQKGQKVMAGLTEIGSIRRLGINSQIDQYLGQITTHIHLQVNPLEGEELNFAKGESAGD